jgi:hypothetical protein
MTEVIGHLDVLAEQDEARAHERGGVIEWQPAFG